MSRCFSIFLKSLKHVSSHQLNSKNNGLVLLLKTILKHWNCFLSSVATDGKDGNGLKLEKIGPIFLCFDAMSSKITKKIYNGQLSLIKFIWYLPHSFTGAFCVWVKALSYAHAELT